jgi:hypothetical protein
MTTYSKTINSNMKDWIKIDPGDYVNTGASSISITTNRDMTSEISVGYPIKLIASTPYTMYGIVNAISSTTITLSCAGAVPTSGTTITALYYGFPNKVKQLSFSFIGPYSVVASTTLCQSFNVRRWFWKSYSKARIVHIFVRSEIIGATAHNITVYNNGNSLLSFGTLAASNSPGSSTTYNIDYNYNQLAYSSEIEVGTTLGATTGTLASNLSVELIVVME